MTAQKRSVYEAAYDCLMQSDVGAKLRDTHQLYTDWQEGKLSREVDAAPVQSIPAPGRPAKPELVHPRKVKHRKLTSPAGRMALLHAVSHIEFNAINLALDAAYRFRDMPDDYYGDWLKVASEEAYHFGLMRDRMALMDGRYGDLPAHNGLWEQACKTDYDVLVRMALVPRVLEARGLDVTPPMIEKLRLAGDEESIAVLEIILRDEIGHVKIGSDWYRYCCELQGLEPEAHFRALLRDVMKAPLRGPFYEEGRLLAGFSAEEIEQLRLLEEHWVAEITD